MTLTATGARVQLRTTQVVPGRFVEVYILYAQILDSSRARNAALRRI